MAFAVTEDSTGVTVTLSGWDRLLSWRRRVEMTHRQIRSATLARRGDLEPSIDHRLVGIGSHDGARRPGGRRTGSMMGRRVRGKQFWAVGRGESDSVLVVLDLEDHEFARAVLAVADAHKSVERIRAGREPGAQGRA